MRLPTRSINELIIFPRRQEWETQMKLYNHLFYGDNLGVLRTHVPDESVDLIYLDPPFNSNAN